MNEQNNKTNKLTDKAFSRFALTSLISILVCIICLSATTYAWFTGSVQSPGNTIKTASECLLVVTVKEEGSDTVVSTVYCDEPVTVEGMSGRYAVTLSLPANSASGYLTISAGGRKYYSECLKRNAEAEQTLTFYLNVSEAQDVTFTVRWGIHSGDPDVLLGGELSI